MNRPMRISIISTSNSERYYKLLDKKFNELIEASQNYWFYILCGFVEGKGNGPITLGEKWAERNGCPILYVSEKTKDDLVRRLFLEADYIFFLLDGNPFINKLLMQYKMTGKHGSVIKVNE